MKRRLPVLVALSALILPALGGGPAFAHHSATATYIVGKSVKIEGTLKELIWRNPHSYIKVEAPDDKGDLQIWVIEGAAPGQLAEQGLTANRLRPGDHVIVTGLPGRIAEDHRLLLETVERPSDGLSGAAPRPSNDDADEKTNTSSIRVRRSVVAAALCHARRAAASRCPGRRRTHGARRCPGRFDGLLGIGRHRTVALPHAGAR